MMLALTVDVDGERKILARLEQVQLFFEQKRVGAHVDVLLARDQTGNDLRHLWMQQWLAAWDCDHRGAALLHRLEAVLGRKLCLLDVGGILDLSAAGASQVAAEQRLQHQHERILLPAHELLLQYVSSYGPSLRDWHGHPVSPPSKKFAQPSRSC